MLKVENQNDDNELEKTLIKVKNCLKRAIDNNNGEPVIFHKFAIDPLSLSYTVENLFHIASLLKDGLVKIEQIPGYNMFIKTIALISHTILYSE